MVSMAHSHLDSRYERWASVCGGRAACLSLSALACILAAIVCYGVMVAVHQLAPVEIPREGDRTPDMLGATAQMFVAASRSTSLPPLEQGKGKQSHVDTDTGVDFHANIPPGIRYEDAAGYNSHGNGVNADTQYAHKHLRGEINKHRRPIHPQGRKGQVWGGQYEDPEGYGKFEDSWWGGFLGKERDARVGGAVEAETEYQKEYRGNHRGENQKRLADQHEHRLGDIPQESRGKSEAMDALSDVMILLQHLDKAVEAQRVALEMHVTQGQKKLPSGDAPSNGASPPADTVSPSEHSGEAGQFPITNGDGQKTSPVNQDTLRELD